MVWSGNAVSSAADRLGFNGNWVERGWRARALRAAGQDASVRAALLPGSLLDFLWMVWLSLGL